MQVKAEGTTSASFKCLKVMLISAVLLNAVLFLVYYLGWGGKVQILGIST